MELSKTAEKYVKFAQFCILHKVKPHLVAEAITLCQSLSRTSVRWEQFKKNRNAVMELLTGMGFREIKFEDDWPVFLDKLDDQCRLPLEAF